MRFLHLEDNPIEHELLVDLLELEGLSCEVVWVSTEAAFVTALNNGPYNAILSDFGLPGYDGLSALKVARHQFPETPFIFVSGTIGEERAIEALRTGATDYVLKMNMRKLPMALKRALAEAQNLENRRRAEDHMHQSEQRYRSLVVATSQIVWSTDPDGRVAGPQESWQQYTGQTTTEVWGTGWLSAVHPNEVDQFSQAWARSVQSHIVFTMECRIRAASGKYGYFSVRGVPVQGDDGHLREWVGTCTDISQRKRAEQDLEDQLQQQAEVADLSQCAFSGLEDGPLMDEACRRVARLLRADRVALFEYLGNTEEAILRHGTGWAPELMGMEKVSARRDTFLGAASAETAPLVIEDLTEDRRFAVPLLIADSQMKGCLSISMQVRNKPYGVLQVCSACRRKFTAGEAHFLKSVANILVTSIERGRDQEDLKQSQQQFLQAQKMEAIGRLAGGVAHDFNNLLSIILGYTEILQDGVDAKSRAAKMLEDVKNAGLRAAGLTRQLLAFSRRQVLQPRVVDVGAIVVELHRMLQRLIGEDIGLAIDGVKKLNRVRADPGQLEQVVMNLVVNARDAMPRSGTITIQVESVERNEEALRLHPGVAAGRYVMLSVKDTGEGMSQEVQSRIFDPFFTTKAADRGTGLGLATVLGIVQQSDGHIEVESAPGQGSTFRVYLPQIQDALDVRKDAAVRQSAATGQTILLVEDDGGVRMLATNILQRAGYVVLAAGCAAEARTICDSHNGPIHLLLTDVIMPEVSGPELARSLAGLRPDMAILMMSGYTDDTIERYRVTDSQWPLMEKPFTPTLLTEKVATVLAGQKRP